MILWQLVDNLPVRKKNTIMNKTIEKYLKLNMFKFIGYMSVFVITCLCLISCTNSQRTLNNIKNSDNNNQIIKNNNNHNGQKRENIVIQPTKQQLLQASNLNVELGLYYLQHHNSVLAQKKFILALNQAQYNFLAYNGMAFFLEHIGKITQAEQYYLQAIQIANKYKQNISVARNNYGKFLYRQQRCQEALRQFKFVTEDLSYVYLDEINQNISLAKICKKISVN